MRIPVIVNGAAKTVLVNQVLVNGRRVAPQTQLGSDEVAVGLAQRSGQRRRNRRRSR